MKTLITIISLILLIGLISIPIFLFIAIKKSPRLRFKFLLYLIVSSVLTVGIMFTFAWWAYYSDQLLMSHYGYNFDAMNDIERYGNIATENLEKVKQLEFSHFGIGWPLKAIMTYIFYSPYLIIVYFIGQLIIKMNKKF